MYYLMNKDNVTATIEIKRGIEFSDTSKFEIVEVSDKLPIGFSDINVWLENRKGSKYNTHLQAIMKRLSCEDNEGFIRVTHAAAINDTFWIKQAKENVSWKQVSLYCNQFTEAISKLAFEGVGLNDVSFSYTSPELTCEGSFRKCFRKENEVGEYGSDIFLYKRGGEIDNGFEPYCEVMASEIAGIISPDNSVSYRLVRLHDKLASRCNLFTNEKYGYASFAKIPNAQRGTLQDIFEYFKKIGSEQFFRELLVTDALCFNQDRHSGNYGVLFNNDTLEIVDIAPIFDMNISLLPYVTTEDLKNIGDKLYECSPKLGEDFTRLGQMGINDNIRDRVKDMCDFSFTFRGDDVFPAERVKRLEEVVRRQAKAILSTEKLYTKDVFFSQKAKEDEENKEKHLKANELMLGFARIVEDIDLGEDVIFSVCGSNQLIIENLQYMLTIDFYSGIIDVSKNMNHTPFNTIKKEDNDFWKTCVTIVNRLRAYMKQKGNNLFDKSLKAYSYEISNLDEQDKSGDDTDIFS